ncbi:hypothetical protein KIN20_011557 [Parelaphostrongylus tenuis]|uniref:Uncharacterized protein n=1 Tax=Parelaphostrongylus tenuis TaxID=148309 RepID=A0AAD5MB20_PARTN|nr:hypothetical protein KIN20_011557 [Parelaphostrongylus tenuis]
MYSSDIAALDYYLFRALKQQLREKELEEYDYLKSDLTHFFGYQPHFFWKNWIQSLPSNFLHIIDDDGDHTADEKEILCVSSAYFSSNTGLSLVYKLSFYTMMFADSNGASLFRKARFFEAQQGKYERLEEGCTAEKSTYCIEYFPVNDLVSAQRESSSFNLLDVNLSFTITPMYRVSDGIQPSKSGANSPTRDNEIVDLLLRVQQVIKSRSIRHVEPFGRYDRTLQSRNFSSLPSFIVLF